MSVDNQGTLQDRHIETGGGTYVEGSIDTGGGGFVGRDKIVYSITNLFLGQAAPGMLGRERSLQTLVSGLGTHLERLQKAPSSAAASRPVPPLLPYLPDRRKQEEVLAEALQQHAQLPPRLLICLLHGDEYQCHDAFREKLGQVLLPEFLRLNNASAVKSYPLAWPGELDDVDKLRIWLQRSLSRELIGHKEATVQEINAKLAAHPGPVVIYTTLLTRDWEKHGSKGLEEFLHFWDTWPMPSYFRRLYVLVLIEYELKLGMNPFRRLKCQALNKGICRFLEATSFSGFDQLFCVLLPRLTSIDRGDAEDWVRRSVPEDLWERQELILVIQDIFRDWEKSTSSRTIPMAHLAPILRTLLSG